MRTPIFDFVSRYIQKDAARFHMPGHKGQGPLGCEALDITEIGGADVLYEADGIIAESEQNASELFGSAHSYYSTEGSTLCIKAMLALVTQSRTAGERKPYILAARNAHKAFVYACALLDLEAEWLYPTDNTHCCSCPITADDVKAALADAQEPPCAVYLTSPDYLGQLADIEGIASVCHRYGVPLLVDNAHGAYLRFLETDRHPLSLGADMCCDSAHKTLSVLTGGAYLHISKSAVAYCEGARRALSLFASTSPSYLILQSLDLCNRYLCEGYREKLQNTVKRLEQTKRLLAQNGFEAEPSEPMKLTLRASRTGYTGETLAALLREKGIEVEFADAEYLVLMVTPENREADFLRLEQAFAHLSPRTPIKQQPLPAVSQKRAELSIRQAMLAPQERVAVGLAEGRICASPNVSCPPAVPIVISGERITAEDVALLRHYGIQQIDVVK